MRFLPALAAIGAALAVTACTYVEKQPPAQTVVQPPPATVVQPAPSTTPPTVTVRPSY
jgi:multidrug efflux pump subunit AcrA (membrane-fusion protein)